MVAARHTAPTQQPIEDQRNMTPALDRSAWTHIVSVCVHGRDRHPAPLTDRRIALLASLTAKLSARLATWPSVDAVLLPGGFMRLQQGVSQIPHAFWPAHLKTQTAGQAMAEASRRLSNTWPGVAFVTGLDSPRISSSYGGDELAVAWIDGAIVAYARKAFPVRVETSGYEHRPNRDGAIIWAPAPSLWFDPTDADNPSRLLALRNGQSAMLLSCYDAFAARAIRHISYIGNVGLRLIKTGNGLIRPATAAERVEHINRWCSFLKAHPPDLALVTIHLFSRPGAENYWQRHGVAGASSALQGVPVIGAAHFAEHLPHHIGGAPLAASCAPLSHLDQGPRRRMLSVAPIDGFFIADKHGEPTLLVRLYRCRHCEA